MPSPASSSPLRVYRRRGGSWLVSDNRYDTDEVRALRRGLLRDEEFAAADRALAAAKSFEERAYLAEALADWWDKPPFLSRWPASSPSSSLVRGIHGVKWAWRLRGAGWVPQNFPQFQARLREAHIELVNATSRVPKDPVPWAWLIDCCRGMQEVDQGEEAFREATARAPMLRRAYSAILLNRLPDWFGSVEQATETVRQALAIAKPGSGLLTLPCELAVFTQPRDPKSTAPWATSTVAGWVRRANAAYFGSGQIVESAESLRNRNWFAHALWKLGDKDAAAVHLRAIGRVPQVLPWGEAHPIIDWAISDFKKARRQCL